MFICIVIVCFSKKVNSHFSHMCPEELKDFFSSGSILVVCLLLLLLLFFLMGSDSNIIHHICKLVLLKHIMVNRQQHQNQNNAMISTCITTVHTQAAVMATEYFSSVQFNCSVVSNSLWPHGLQHTRLPCPSPTLRACSNSCPSSRWCHPTITSSVVPFSFCPLSFPLSGSFLMSQFFSPSGQSVEVPTSASFSPVNIQDWLVHGSKHLQIIFY